MIRTGEEYRAGLRDGREIWIEGEPVCDVTAHAAFKPVVDLKAHMYDMAHEAPSAEIMSFSDADERYSTLLRPPTEKSHWHEKWRAIDLYLNDIRGVLTRVGDETVGEMWSLLDGREVLNEIDPRFGENITRHIRRVLQQDLFHVSANTDPKGDRSKRPQDQDPDMMVHVVKETDAGIVLRGAKYETAASYADQAFLKPTIASWADEQLSDYAVGCIVKMGAPGVKHLCRSGFAGRGSSDDYPLANRFDEVDTLVVLDNVMIPWEDVFFYRHTRRIIHPRHTASLFGIPLRPAHSLHRRYDDRRDVVECEADGARQDAGGT
jgi:4-hydroxyphenylacetate 3-monooxygenase